MTLLIETDDGILARRIQPARALSTDVEVGPAAEDATRQAAATWGLPDFVFRSIQQASGSGVRELGDAILMAGDLAAVVQVKARTERGQNLQRERSWLDSRIVKAARQAVGTIRKLGTKPAITLINERDRGIEIRPAGKTWLSVVVIDHPGVPDYVPREHATVLLRRDWDFLFDQLRSTVAVLQYLKRVEGLDPVALGDETIRYYELVHRDSVAFT
ncbi:hypothetical protein [Actinoplanes sp. CA-252034]|uniref:hypothetical protein n=1 Tax=Actinoplanes sp. CA-252034 TaxID=3239906 RepID=UPI003D96496D